MRGLKALSWLGLILALSPLGALALLAVLPPVDDLQHSGSIPPRILDFQGSYWIREAIPVPPPQLLVGVLISVLVNKRHRSAVAQTGTMVGAILLSLWAAVMLIPLLVHVN